MNNKKRIIIGILALLVVMTMGYALFSETVTIGGTAKGEGNLSVIFNDIDMSAIELSAGAKVNKIALTNNKKTLDIDISFDYPSSIIMVPITIKNNGTIDAYVKNINIKGIDNRDKIDWDNQDVIAILLDENFDDYSTQSFDLKVGENKNYYLQIMWNPNMENIKNNLKSNFSVELEYEQYINSGIIGDNEEIKPNEKFKIGRKFCLGNECFNIINDKGDTVEALASYKLTTDLSKDVIQTNSLDKVSNKVTFLKDYSSVSSLYWLDENNKLKKGYKYNGWQPYDVYPPIEEDKGKTNIEFIVNNYIDYLAKQGYTISNHRLLTYNDMLNLGCTFPGLVLDNYGICDNSPYSNWIINGQDYWTSSTFKSSGEDRDYLLVVYGSKRRGNDIYIEYVLNGGNVFGVRPVIEIKKSYISY